MRTKWAIWALVWLVLGLDVWTAWGQERQVQTTDYTRGVLRAPDPAAARAALGIVATNQSVVAATGVDTNFISTNGGTLQLMQMPMTRNMLKLRAVTEFGAKGNGVCTTKCNTTAASTTMTVTSGGAFSSADIGKVISIYGAGAGGLNLTTTIAAVATANSITLASPAVLTTTGVSCVYGTDDTAAIQSGINAVCAAGGGTLFFPSGIYVLNGPIQDPGYDEPCYDGGRTRVNFNKNAQLIAPNMTPSGQTAPVLRFEGAENVSAHEPIGGNSGEEFSAYGSVLWSTLPNHNGGSMFACENFVNPVFTVGGADQSRRINNLRVEIVKMNWRMPRDPRGNAIDLRGATTGMLRDVLVDCGYGLYRAPQPTYRNSFGVWLPGVFAHSDSTADRLQVIGFYNGIGMGEHLNAGDLMIFSCMIAYNCTNAGGHLNIIARSDIESCKVWFQGGTIPNTQIITYATGENTACTNVTWLSGNWPAWDYPEEADPPTLINDPLNTITGRIGYYHTDFFGYRNGVPMKKVGGAKIEVTRFGNALPVKESEGGVQTDYVKTKGNAYGVQVVQDAESAAARVLWRTTDSGTAPLWTAYKRIETDTGGAWALASATNPASFGPKDWLLVNPVSGQADFLGLLQGNASVRALGMRPNGFNFEAITAGDTNIAGMLLRTSESSTSPFWTIVKRKDSDTGGFMISCATNPASFGPVGRLGINAVNGDVDLYGNLTVAGGVVKNGGLYWIVTNNVPDTSYPNGSICTRTDTGFLYVKQGGTWTQK